MQPLRSPSRPCRCPWGLFVVCAVFGVAGCTSTETLHPVSGKVTSGGAPVTGGVVTFVGDGANAAKGQPIAMIGADGTYTPTTNGKKGVPAGKYKVSVSSMAPPPADATQSAPVPKAGGVNRRYMNAEMSGLTIEVPSTSPDGYDLKLIK